MHFNTHIAMLFQFTTTIAPFMEKNADVIEFQISPKNNVANL